MNTFGMQRRLATSALLTLASASAWAQTAQWPTKPVRIVVGFSAGGPTDVVALAFAEHAARVLGQPVIVDNKPGANTILAAEAVASAPADGHTLLMAATNHTMIPALYSARVKFDAVRSFAPVCTLAVSPTVLVIGPAMTAKNLSTFMQQVREAPGKRSYGTPGIGSSGHFASEQFLRMAGLTMNHIPYKGAAQVVTDVMGGQIDFMITDTATGVPQIKAGKLRALGFSMTRRSPLLPDLPTLDEAGVKGYDMSYWFAAYAPAGTPAPVIKRLNELLTTAVRAAAAKAFFETSGAEAWTSTPEELARDQAAETLKWGKVIKAAGIEPE